MPATLMDELQKIEELFQAAADLSVEGRQAFLDEACPDAGRRERVLALLRRLDAGDSLEPVRLSAGAAPGEPEARQNDPGERPGTVIGRYKLLQHLGDGGFGSVWMAEQKEPVIRKVALKIIKLGMDTREVVARFEAERQALAMMDHPNIARVFDGGTTESGRPYFVMELVRGISITEYASKEKLDTRARIELFCEVCQAVQHAHQKGVIHRDLKPSNVMVTLHDGRPVPKVIDFGIAKAMHTRLTEKTLFTQYRQFIGTPVYMSPEQAEMSGLDVDTRADIYSLGVLLYELLTGTTPFDLQTLIEHGYGEIQRVIREEEPPKPSARISTLGESSTSIAQERRLNVTGLRKRLQGDLDWIVMRALEKDRGRRYATATDFAEDLRRHLEHEPVAAGPPSTVYRLRKLLVRNRMVVGWAATIAIALLAGIVGTTWGMVEAARQRDDAIQARLVAESQRQAAAAAEANEKDARLHAEESARAALAVTSYLQGTLALTDPVVAGGGERSVRDLLDQASADAADSLGEQPLAEALIRSTIGRAYASLNELELADAHLRRAAELMALLDDVDGQIHYETLWALTEVSFRLGRTDAYAKATEARRVGHAHVARRKPELARALDSFVEATDELDVEAALLRFSMVEPMTRLSLPEGDPLWLIVADTWRHAGYSWWYTPVEERSEPFWRAALEIHRRELPLNHPARAETLALLVGLLNRTGRAGEAEAELRESLIRLEEVLGKDSARAAFAGSMLGETLSAQGRFEEAEELLLSANDVLSQVDDATGFYPVDATKRLVILYDAWERPEQVAPYRAQLVRNLADARFLSPFSIAMPAFDPQHEVLLGAIRELDAWAMGIADGTNPEPRDPSASVETLASECSRLYQAEEDSAVLVARFLVGWSAVLEGRATEELRRRMLDAGLVLLENQAERLPLDVADALAQRSLIARATGEAELANEDARRSWKTLQRFEGEHPWWEAQTKVRIARGLFAQGLHAEAEEILLASYDVMVAQLGERHKETVIARAALQALYTSWGRPGQASTYAPRNGDTP